MGRAPGGRVTAAERTIDCGLCYQPIQYSPLPSQARFHASTARFKGFSGPVGSGKSQALCQEAIKLSYLNPGRCGLLGAPTYPMLRDATQAALFEILGKNGIPYDFNKAEGVLKLADTGSKVLLRAVDDYERLRGTNLAWFGVDELTYTVPEAWTRLEGRLRDPKARRLCGFAVWTPKGFDWVYSRFVASPVNGYEAVVAPPFENSHVLDKVPDFYERLKHSYDQRFYEQEVLGEYVNSSGGRVYHAFDRRQNVKPTFCKMHLPVRWALDFNVDPMSSVVAQTDGEDVYVIREFSLRRASTEDACEAFYKEFGDHPAGVIIYGDATGARRQSTGYSDFEMVTDFFARKRCRNWRMDTEKSNPPVRDRVHLVNAWLGAADGRRRLLVDPCCGGVIRDLEEVLYRAGSSDIDKERDRERTHLSDALGYLLWQQFGRKGSVGERRRRLL